jgi:hypothetical protein
MTRKWEVVKGFFETALQREGGDVQHLRLNIAVN